MRRNEFLFVKLSHFPAVCHWNAISDFEPALGQEVLSLKFSRKVNVPNDRGRKSGKLPVYTCPHLLLTARFVASQREAARNAATCDNSLQTKSFWKDAKRKNELTLLKIASMKLSFRIWKERKENIRGFLFKSVGLAACGFEIRKTLLLGSGWNVERVLQIALWLPGELI